LTDDLVWAEFGKHRRSLILVSISLFLYSGAGIKIDQINILGTVIRLEDQYWLTMGFWLVWLYFLTAYSVIEICFLRPAPENSKIAPSTERRAAFVIPRELYGACAGPRPRF